jgi:hypothetical protein
LKAEAKKLGANKPVAAILEAAAARWQPQGALLDEYTRVTAETRRQFEDADFVSFPPREKCRVMPVPKYLRHQFPTAAYVQPGPFDRNQTGIFWVNDLSAEQPTPEKRAAEIRQHFGLALTCAHEPYSPTDAPRHFLRRLDVVVRKAGGRYGSGRFSGGAPRADPRCVVAGAPDRYRLWVA